MGKLEKFGRSILRKLSGNRRRRENATSSGSTSSDEEPQTATVSRSLPDMYIHKFQVVPPEEPLEEPLKAPLRMGSPAASDEGSAGYATDDTALSSLSPLELKRSSVDYSESQGYYSTAELSPIPRIVLEPPEDAPESPAPPRTPLFYKKQDYPRINVSKRFKSSLALSPDSGDSDDVTMKPKIDKRMSATLSNLTEDQDPIEKFLKSSIYKTKMITTVFEAKDGGFEVSHFLSQSYHHFLSGDLLRRNAWNW